MFVIATEGAKKTLVDLYERLSGVTVERERESGPFFTFRGRNVVPIILHTEHQCNNRSAAHSLGHFYKGCD